jgi:hypothetical protein
MPTIIETATSRDGEEAIGSQKRTIRYLVEVALGETEELAYQLVEGTAPLTYIIGQYPRTGISWKWVEGSTTHLLFEVSYDSQSADEINFDTKGGRERIYYALNSIARYGVNGAPAPLFNGGINVSKSGVGGVDIAAPGQRFSIKRRWMRNAITEDYLRTLFEMSGTVNDSKYQLTAANLAMRFDRRELLFLGASLTHKADNSVVYIQYDFEASYTVYDLEIGDSGITVPVKRGMDYLWVSFDSQEDPATNTLVDSPVGAYIEQVYREKNFANLRL